MERALRAGETESAVVPLQDTVQILEVIDQARAQIGVRYPADEGVAVYFTDRGIEELADAGETRRSASPGSPIDYRCSSTLIRTSRSRSTAWPPG